MAPLVAHQTIFYSYPLSLSLLLFPFISGCPAAYSNSSVYQVRHCVRRRYPFYSYLPVKTNTLLSILS